MLRHWLSRIADHTELFGLWEYLPEHWFDQSGDVSDELAMRLR